MNQAQIIGNVTQDIELSETKNGVLYTRFSVATNRKWKNSEGEQQEEAEFHNVIFWGKPAEIIAQYVKKGDKLYVQGRLRTERWLKEGETGKRQKTEIIGTDFEFLGMKEKSQATQQQEEYIDEQYIDPET